MYPTLLSKSDGRSTPLRIVSLLRRELSSLKGPPSDMNSTRMTIYCSDARTSLVLSHMQAEVGYWIIHKPEKVLRSLKPQHDTRERKERRVELVNSASEPIKKILALLECRSFAQLKRRLTIRYFTLAYGPACSNGTSGRRKLI